MRTGPTEEAAALQSFLARMGDFGFSGAVLVAKGGEILVHQYCWSQPHGTTLAREPNWNLRGAADVLTTAGDLCLWVRALESGKVLAREAVDRLWNGFGWSTRRTEHGVVQGCGGTTTFGFHAVLERYPEQHLLVIVMSNRNYGLHLPVEGILEGIRGILLGTPHVRPPEFPSEAQEAPPGLAGTFVLAGGAARFQVRQDGRGLVVGAEGQEAVDLLLASNPASAERHASLGTDAAALLDAARKRESGGDSRDIVQALRGWIRGMEGRHGRLEEVSILGTIPEPGTSRTYVAFRFEGQDLVRRMRWQGATISSVLPAGRPLVETRFMPRSASEFVGYHPAFRREIVIRFDVEGNGPATACEISGRPGPVWAARSIVLAAMTRARADDPKDISKELTELYRVDQEDQNQWDRIGDAEASRRQGVRRERAFEIVSKGMLAKPIDYHHASWLLQHGKDQDDVLLAHILATTASFNGFDDAFFMSAAALDRFMMSVGQAQRFGSQSLDARGTELGDTSSLLSETIVRSYGGGWTGLRGRPVEEKGRSKSKLRWARGFLAQTARDAARKGNGEDGEGATTEEWRSAIAKTLEIVDQGLLEKAADYYHAAVILSHGRGKDELLLAHVMATTAGILQHRKARPLYMRTLDRYMLSLGRAPIFSDEVPDGRELKTRPAVLDLHPRIRAAMAGRGKRGR